VGIIKVYVSAYHEEKKKTRSSALRDQSNATRLGEEAKPEIRGVIPDDVEGLIDDDESASLLAPLH
jgi:hypothetical protein